MGKRKGRNKGRPANLAKLRRPQRPWAGQVARTHQHASPLLRRGEKASTWIIPRDHRDAVSRAPSCHLPLSVLRDFPKPPAPCVAGDSKLLLLSKVSFVKCFLGRENVWDSWRGAPCAGHKEPCVHCENTGRLLPSLPLGYVYLKLPLPREDAGPEHQAGLMEPSGCRPITECRDHSCHEHRPRGPRIGEPGQDSGRH